MIASPSSSIADGATAFSSATSSGVKRARGNATSEYSSVSAMRPTRSWCFTRKYFSFTFSGVVSFDGAMSSRITLNTYGNEGSVNTVITRPLMPGATMKSVGRVLEVMQEVAEEERLALLLQADHRVELGLRCARGTIVLQERDVGRRHLHVDQEVRAVGREQQRDLVRVEQQRVDVELCPRRRA